MKRNKRKNIFGTGENETKQPENSKPEIMAKEILIIITKILITF